MTSEIKDSVTANKVDKQKIFNQVWSIANDLRGGMDANDYKNYILGFLFYRYLNVQLEPIIKEFIKAAFGEANKDLSKEELDNLVNEKIRKERLHKVYDEAIKIYVELVGNRAEYQGLNEDQKREKFIKGELADSFNRAGRPYIIRPEYCWDALLDNIETNTINYNIYQNAFVAFNEDNTGKNSLKNIFHAVNINSPQIGSTTNERINNLNKLVTKLEGMPFKDESGQDLLGAIYEYLIGKFAASAGKSGGEFYTPHEVSVLISKIISYNLISDKKASEEINRKVQNSQITVFDPTCGSGSLLLTVRQSILERLEEENIEITERQKENLIRFYGKEKNYTTYNLARMNLFMHEVNSDNFELSEGDTLDFQYPVKEDSKKTPIKVDAVVANPPYSAHWDPQNKEDDPRFSPYGKLAPKTKADFAFLLHGLYHLDDHGTMGIVLPHGVLFRSAAEATIRENLIKKNYLDAVIGLPSNLFYGTGIPTIILIFRKGRTTNDVLFIDASTEFEKDKRQNRLTEENIEKILQTYINRVDVDKYAHVATLEEIEENEYNLNIPRYVQTYEEEEPIDLEEVLRNIEIEKREIQRLEDSIYAQLKELGVDVEKILKDIK
ncbi:type I restriction-modification system subunit M [Psittacicella melopsittaci]|uniref:site-specific DNA-methyltransferase (adenine-specific) n=1 Tax=Psittacicella melopsittaci TaxID=2028576 RepID=A0A3A1Y8A9_9GAMM|nr:type I restriction-modification system subunit M [Psittacicella melopsittaci]RIY33470.1 type I restriction-modification system subunit M [Psittacicella melopsittaci]